MFLDHWLVNRTLPQDYNLHSVENNLNLLDLLGGKRLLPEHDSEIFLAQDEIKWAAEFVEGHQLADKRILGIHVGSGKTKNLELRRWPLENYIELIRRLVSANPKFAVLLFGGPEERSDHETILARAISPFVKVVTSKNLRQAAALLQECHVFLSVDTAMMHLAAAVKVPRQLVIETPTFNKTIEPYRRPYVLINNPAVKGRNLDYYRYDGRGIQGTAEELRQCMLSVTVEEVFAHVNKALSSVSSGR
jgi:ADP-heptose:LPS heptosyltransferase